ncbi:MAG: hypothetical protein K1000chlam2_00049 [Chlamydiae bacterium]|nr:hypothetical protein [Chlamydiota bacterium]
MDFDIIFTVVASSLSVIGVNLVIFSWFRSDMKIFEVEIRSWKEEINQEMKDFHGRLCTIEERRK